MNRDGFSELLGPYVMGELTADEEWEMERHLRECPECRSELEDVQRTHDLLQESVTVGPPPELKDWVMTRARNEIPSDSGSGWKLWAPFAAALLVAVISGALIFQTIVARPSGGLELASTGLAPKAGGEVQGKEVGGNFQVKLNVWGLPKLRHGEYYEMWYAKDGEGRISCGTFKTQPNGHATVSLNAPVSAEAYPEIEITREPDDGDPGTSGEQVLRGNLNEL